MYVAYGRIDIRLAQGWANAHNTKVGQLLRFQWKQSSDDKATISEILVSCHPSAYVLRFCVKSSLCIATIYKAPRLLTEHNQ